MLFDPKKFRESLPPEMLKERRFVRYFLKPKPEGGTAKIPLGSHSDPSTWSTFEDCVNAIENNQQGVGYNFLGGDVHGLDIDHCRNPHNGQLCNEAMMLLSRLPSWAEYSVSGCGIHVFFVGQVRGKQLTETCLQYWNPKNSPRFFALTCDMVGDAFTKLKDIGEEFNYVFATARHISAKIREELRVIDYEQWVALPKEREVAEVKTHESSKTKSRKLNKSFNMEDFLAFYGLQIDNVADKSDIGKCYRVTTCPIKGEAHVGHNSTTTNFILSVDGGLGFHCQSTGCVEYSVSDVIKKLAEDKGPYPHAIYDAPASKQQVKEEKSVRSSRRQTAASINKEHLVWLWPGYLQANQLVHLAGASGEGKSPITRDIVARLSSGKPWPDGSVNEADRRGVLMLASEDDWSTVIRPSLELAGADLERVFKFITTVVKGDTVTDVTTALDQDVQLLRQDIEDNQDIGMVIIDPITNYLGRLAMNKDEEMRGLLMPLALLAQENNVCVMTVGHLNKRDKDTPLQQRIMGAAAFFAVARQTIFCSRDPEDENKFSHVMGFGRGTSTSALRYKTEMHPLEWGGKASEVVTIAWGEKCDVDIEAAVTTPLKQQDKSDAKQVRQIVQTFLRDGQKTTEQIEQVLKENGIKDGYNWRREAAKIKGISNHKGGVERKGDKHYWWMSAPKMLEFDK